jgi:(1->4)-alpha-D-glucan 1-alpha-D-glucosylmutase
MQAYLVKATREEKRATSWMNPNTQYEQAIGEFVARLLEAADQNAFLKDFTTLAEIVSFFGHLNSLVQTILKLTSPGVPDLYQGTEAVTLALVDPDNRRPVDYEGNARLFDELLQLSAEESRSRLATALAAPYSSDAKLFVTSRLLQLRRECAALFASGDYEPLQTSGQHKEHVLAFGRTREQKRIVVVLAKWMARLMKAERQVPIGDGWADTGVLGALGGMRDIFTGERVTAGGDAARAAELFKLAPFAVLVAD